MAKHCTSAKLIALIASDVSCELSRDTRFRVRIEALNPCTACTSSWRGWRRESCDRGPGISIVESIRTNTQEIADTLNVVTFQAAWQTREESRVLGTAGRLRRKSLRLVPKPAMR